MGVGDGRLWEVQWHPASGGRVRRVVLTRRSLRRLAVIAGAALLFLLAFLATLPLGVRAVFARLGVDAVAREGRVLNAERERLRERMLVLSADTMARLDRGRRLAWAAGLPEQTWRSGAPAFPEPTASDDAVAQWLWACGEAVATLAERLATLPPAPPCPLAALPTAPPLSVARAVPVALFGFRVSPFTGKREAHHGVTLAAPAGEAVVAPGAGTVVFAGEVRERHSNEWTRFGKVAVLNHGGGVVTVFGSLDAVLVKRGQAVRRGDRLGTVGQSGWTRVPALYYEVRWPLEGASRPVDPALFDLALPLESVSERFADPRAALPEDYALIEHLPGGRFR